MEREKKSSNCSVGELTHNSSAIGVGGSMLWGKRDNYESETLKNKQNLHEFLERQAHTAIQGELNSQRKLTEAETVTEVEEWDKRNSEFVLYESQRD